MLSKYPNPHRLVVGVSEDSCFSCFSCYHALTRLRDDNVKVNVRACHGKVYLRWRKPSWLGQDDASLEAQLESLWQKKLRATKPRDTSHSDISYLAQTHSDISHAEDQAEELRKAWREITAMPRQGPEIEEKEQIGVEEVEEEDQGAIRLGINRRRCGRYFPFL